MSAVEEMPSGAGGLRAVLETTATETGLSMGELTIQATQNDPYRVDTPANHRLGAWLAEHAQRQVGEDPNSTIHLRGLHYKLVSTPDAIKPNGVRYANTDADWSWLVEKAAKAARWLGYIPFDRIKDARNNPPVIRVFEPATPTPFIGIGVNVHIPDVSDLRPTVFVDGFTGVQPYKLVLFGEKTSLETVLNPIAATYDADLYLPSGDISDTLLHTIAKTGVEDGRPMVVLAFSDCDPSGWHMPTSIGHKLRALRDSLYPDLDFQVHRVALTPDQVAEHDLPSTPLKTTERRADKWTQATGTEQTEIDALAALQPDLLHEIVVAAIEHFYDRTLSSRVIDAEMAWRREAQAQLLVDLDSEQLAKISEQATDKLGELRDEIDALNDALQIEVDPDSLPPIRVPSPITATEAHPLPLVASGLPFAEHCARLTEAKAYRGPGVKGTA